ncbi:MAG: FHA domain-containing protein [Pseudobdellovibrionaceae bacterium]
MGFLRIRLFGNTVTEIELDSAKEYVAGRGDNCDIPLQPEKGISRQHFKILSRGDSWHVEVLSKFGDVFSNGEKVMSLELKPGEVFQVPPYEFEFMENSSSFQLPAVHEPVSENFSEPEPMKDIPQSEGSYDPERTLVGQRVEIPYLRMVDSTGEDKQLLRLAGNGWIAGRESGVDILIDDIRVSRKQFEIQHTSEGYFIRDLGGVNGTILNGNPMAANESLKLRSGDCITVLDNHFYFEMRDPDFHNKVRLAAPIAAAAPLQMEQSYQVMTAPPPIDLPPPSPHIPFTPPPIESDSKQKIIRLALVAIILIMGGYYYLFEMDRPQKTMPTAQAADPFSKLPPEKQNLVKHSYQMAKNLYMKGSYQLAFQELGKLHEILGEYKDSREIEEYCQQAILMQKEIENEERKARETEDRKQKIAAVVAECQKHIHANVDLMKLEECLQPALELDPDNEVVSAIRGEAQRIIEERDMKTAEKKAYLAKVRKRQALFDKAESIEKSEGPFKGIKAYKKFKLSSLPDPYRLEKKADRRIASIQKNVAEQVLLHTAAAKKAEGEQDFKGAFFHLKSALKVDPRRQDIRSDMSRVTSEISKKMKNMYQESVLEESLGRMEDAKSKWRKIMESSVPEEEYFIKAQIKLRNNGELK